MMYDPSEMSQQQEQQQAVAGAKVDSSQIVDKTPADFEALFGVGPASGDPT